MNGKLVYGVGIYTKGKHKATESGKDTKAYKAWQNMLQRCHDPKFKERWPTYLGCVVCDEWLHFQVFADWFHANNPDSANGCHVDKDLKVIGNKIYSPETCIIVTEQVNNFTICRARDRGEYLIGASWDVDRGKFQSGCRNPFTKKRENLGRFTDELSAHLAWRKRKSELAHELAMTQTNPEVRDALLRWKDALDNNEIHTV